MKKNFDFPDEVDFFAKEFYPSVKDDHGEGVISFVKRFDGGRMLIVTLLPYGDDSSVTIETIENNSLLTSITRNNVTSIDFQAWRNEQIIRVYWGGVTDLEFITILILEFFMEGCVVVYTAHNKARHNRTASCAGLTPARQGQNFAQVDFNIDGVSGTKFSLSGYNSRLPKNMNADAYTQIYLIPNKEKLNFTPPGTGSKLEGDFKDRMLDTEVKILADFANAYPTSEKGTINIHSELKVCTSCNSVIDQFKEKFPNINVNVKLGRFEETKYLKGTR